ncbi:hypothetical protein BZG36_03469 [Bifiguratus adelaidae]|uniref:arginyltransferase n=1 Tax=Bifiguratus adelaidae TaxID=1938954 RepID=A0A261XZG9_9FUNG|nr:hypothetical protein BZG36_03469 [Bifiguratus adelaidae]
MAVQAQENLNDKFNSEQVVSILKEISEQVIGDEPYHHTKVADWNAALISKCLERLKANENYKYIVTSVIIQKRGAGFFAGHQALWDGEHDGMWYSVSSCGYCHGSKAKQTCDIAVQEGSDDSLSADESVAQPRRKKVKTSKSYGMVAHVASCQDYQDLIDRGWRRSGTYMYKPNLKESCCPQYTIRLEAGKFKPSKSQRKLVHKFIRYLEGSWEPHNEKMEIDEAQSAEQSQKRPANKKGKQKDTKAEIKTGDEFVDLMLTAEQENPAHKRRFRTVFEPSSFSKAKYEVYKKYQISVHHDPPSKLSERSFRRFLVDSPLKSTAVKTNVRGAKFLSHPNHNIGHYGSYHQCYYLDDTLIAVAILDILPSCVSSVYFMYDPDYSFLSLGKYSALREIALVRELGDLLHYTGLQWYYMGFYIQSCDKMRYKAEYRPSEIKDPYDHEWWDVEQCIPLLQRSEFTPLSRHLTQKQSDAENEREEREEDTAPMPGMLHPEKVTMQQLQQVKIYIQKMVVPLAVLDLDSSPELMEEARTFYAVLGDNLAKRVIWALM